MQWYGDRYHQGWDEVSLHFTPSDLFWRPTLSLPICLPYLLDSAPECQHFPHTMVGHLFKNIYSKSILGPPFLFRFHLSLLPISDHHEDANFRTSPRSCCRLHAVQSSQWTLATCEASSELARLLHFHWSPSRYSSCVFRILDGHSEKHAGPNHFYGALFRL